MVAGGHSFDTSEFVDLFSAYDHITFDTLMQPNANKRIAQDQVGEYDVFVFYDMWGSIDSLEMIGYQHLLSLGKGFVFLHHSLCSYQQWDEFSGIIGGKYYTEWSGAPDSLMSNFKHDIEIPVHMTGKQHPVTSGIQDFMIHDEGYGNIQVNEDVEVILSTDHPDCSKALAWTNNYKESKIVYVMLGHDALAYTNRNFQSIIQNAITYVADNEASPSDGQ